MLAAPETQPTVTLDGVIEIDTFRRGGYANFGVAPAVTLRMDGFSPGLRYDFETGFMWTRRHTRVSVGAEAHILHYYGRKRPAGGVDAVITGSWRMFYIRGGLGTMANMPATRDLDRYRATVGGVIGAGVQTWGDHVGGRLGVDYDFRVDTEGQRIQSVLLTLRVMFG